jgi:hypothetical protein
VYRQNTDGSIPFMGMWKARCLSDGSRLPYAAPCEMVPSAWQRNKMLGLAGHRATVCLESSQVILEQPGAKLNGSVSVARAAKGVGLSVYRSGWSLTPSQLAMEAAHPTM